MPTGPSATVQIRTETLSNEDTEKVRTALFDAFAPKGTDGQPSIQAISDSAVSSTWGGQITQKALIALVVFLVLVSIYITVRYERYMAMAALAAMFFDLIVTAGVYALVGFEVGAGDVGAVVAVAGVSVCYAVGPVILARWLAHLPGLGVITVSLLITTLIYAPIGIAQAPDEWPSAKVVSYGSTLMNVISGWSAATSLTFSSVGPHTWV